MGVEKWAEDGRLAIICDGCGVRVRTQAMTRIEAGRVLSAAGWKQRTENVLECAACGPPSHERESHRGAPRRKHGTRSPATSAPMRGSIVATERGRYTLSFVDGAGRKRFLIWTPPADQRAEASRALVTGEEVTVYSEGHVRVSFQGEGTLEPALRDGCPPSSGRR